jgi:hypothetical protein
MRNFLSIYEGLEGTTHKLPVKHTGHFIIKETEDFFYSSLLALLDKNKKLTLED